MKQKDLLFAMKKALFKALAFLTAIVIFLESCARYDMTEDEQHALMLKKRLNALAKSSSQNNGSAVGLSDQDRLYWNRLRAVLEQAKESREAAEQILTWQTSLPSNSSERLDPFVIRLVSLLADRQLRMAIKNGDNQAVVECILSNREAIETDAEASTELNSILEQIANQLGINGQQTTLGVYRSGAFFAIAPVVAFVVLVAEAALFVHCVVLVSVEAAGQSVKAEIGNLNADTMVVLSQIDSAEFGQTVLEAMSQRIYKAAEKYVVEAHGGKLTPEQAQELRTVIEAYLINMAL